MDEMASIPEGAVSSGSKAVTLFCLVKLGKSLILQIRNSMRKPTFKSVLAIAILDPILAEVSLITFHFAETFLPAY
jgi:hypothetical protein